MKSQCLWMLAAILTLCGTMMTLTSCSNNYDNPAVEVTPQQEHRYKTDWDTSNIPTAMMSLNGVDPDFEKVLKLRFKNQTDMANAELAIVNATDLTVQGEALKALYGRGGVIALTLPTEQQIEDLMDILGLQEECDHDLPSFSGFRTLLYAFNNQQLSYTLFDEEPFDGNYDNKQPESVIEEEYDEEAKDEQDDFSFVYDSDNSADQNENHFQNTIESFVTWLENKVVSPASARTMTRAAGKDGYDPEEDLSKYYQDLTYTFPITLNNRIDKKLGTEWDVLNKSAAVDINYKIYPIYVFSVSPGDAPGDYYTVEGSFTVHNNSLWNPYHQLHGALKDFIIGYFMKDCSFKFELTDSVDKHIDGLKFCKDPWPASTEGSKSYTDGYSNTLGGSITGGYHQGQGANISISASYSHTWEHSTSVTLPDVQVVLNTPDNAVWYKYNVQNFNKRRNWDNRNNDYPLASRSDFNAPGYWIWKIPYGKAGVNDGANTAFKMRCTFECTYGTYNWWRGQKWSREQTWKNQNKNIVYTQTINPPSRIPFGVLALKNNGNNVVADIEVYRQNDPAGAKPYSTIPSGYNKGEVARIKLPTGVYRIRFKLYSPVTNTVLSTYKYENIEVKLGANETEGTTEVSSVNASLTI